MRQLWQLRWSASSKPILGPRFGIVNQDDAPRLPNLAGAKGIHGASREKEPEPLQRLRGFRNAEVYDETLVVGDVCNKVGLGLEHSYFIGIRWPRDRPCKCTGDACRCGDLQTEWSGEPGFQAARYVLDELW